VYNASIMHSVGRSPRRPPPRRLVVYYVWLLLCFFIDFTSFLIWSVDVSLFRVARARAGGRRRSVDPRVGRSARGRRHGATRARRDRVGTTGRSRGRDDDDDDDAMTMPMPMPTRLTKTTPTTRARPRAGRGTRARRGATSASTREDVRDIARDIATATPTSRAHSLADCAYATATTSATMRLRDRVACALAATAIEAVVASGMDPAEGGFGAEDEDFRGAESLLISLALEEAMKRNGDRREVRVRVGYALCAMTEDASEATAHAWLEIEGKVLDVCSPGMILCEAARRSGVDYDDRDAMTAQFGAEALLAAGYAPATKERPMRHRPLTVLNVAVPLGGSRGAREKTKPGYGLTLKPPPAGVRGAANAQKRVEFFQSQVLAAGVLGIEKFKDAAPPAARAAYERIVAARVETVRSREDRLERAIAPARP